MGDEAPTSQQVYWWAVHAYVDPVLQRHPHHPLVGTPAWCQLPDHDRGKIAAIFDAAQHWALYCESQQTAQAQTSRDIAAAADWAAISNEIRRRAASKR